jgi:hypothetical protein
VLCPGVATALPHQALIETSAGARYLTAVPTTTIAVALRLA